MLAVEPRGDNGGDEELGSVGVGASVSGREESGLGVLELEAAEGKPSQFNDLRRTLTAGRTSRQRTWRRLFVSKRSVADLKFKKRAPRTDGLSTSAVVAGRRNDRDRAKSAHARGHSRRGGSALGEVSTLEHEVGDDAVERGSSVSVAVLSGGELAEVALRIGKRQRPRPVSASTGSSKSTHGRLGDDVVVLAGGAESVSS